jgi:DNA-binding XRE family transcriptional regulator
MGQITLRAARTSLGYTREEVAHYCSISTGTYGRYEVDSSLIPIKTIRKIRSLFNIPLELIFIGKERACKVGKTSEIK